ncbi:MAG: ChbG/HpnK family deacetylase [Gammaproteobacteria bacterium]|nr:ChbG/HpnK family deacetylase [Gammaproteobacteria bacterium]MCW5584047.1 ChbG/HpnK family deacetylase [Gammaproteobacteria bacterium]
MKKHIVLCADDYGQAPAISQGIIQLIQMGRISATSCMVNTDDWPTHANWLSPYTHQIDIGLHFNCTEGKALSREYVNFHGEHFQPLSRVLRNAFLRKLNKAALVAECHAQIDAFQKVMSFLPDYIDGHQHVHQFPVIREAVIQVYKQRLRSKNAYIRSVNERVKIKDIFSNFKKIIILAAGSKALTRLLRKNNIPYNLSFAGIYPFQQYSQYPQLFRIFIRQINREGIIMCHPGLNSPDAQDPIAKARFAEYQYLIGCAFIEDCRELEAVIGRFS